MAIFLVVVEKRIAWNGEIVDQVIFQKIYPPPDMCAKKIPLVSMRGWAEGQACADPSEPADFFYQDLQLYGIIGPSKVATINGFFGLGQTL